MQKGTVVAEDEEDQEEEELLQRALEEQAAREVTYKRPLNYAAPTVSSAASVPPRREPPATPPKRAPPKPPPVPEDEESEVELLSISSDEEDFAYSRRAALQTAQEKQAVSERVEEDEGSNLGWDEDDDREPENWKSVDQPEMVRRVREMRETRAAPVAYAPTTRTQRPTTTIDAAPRGEDFIDPLGLGHIDMRTLTLVPKVKSGDSSPALSVASSDRGSSKSRGFLRTRKRAPEVPQKDELESPPAQQDPPPSVRDPATREKAMYCSEKFNPKFFLAHVHQNTSAADLEAGEDALKMDLQTQKDQLKKLVKENFDCFISCKTTIDDIHLKLQQIESDAGSGTLHLNSSIQEIEVVAKRAFAPLLERQAQAERIRSAQGMLQRFRTIFNLPSMIRANISKGEYDLAIREYKKAKSLVLYSNVGILSRVLDEVDKIVEEFKDMLCKSMEDPHIDSSQLENILRLLLELEPDSDPLWHYLCIQDRRIRGLLEACSLEHDARMDALHGRLRERVQSDARWNQLQRESNKASDVDFTLLLGDREKEARESSLKDLSANESDALLGRLIRRLTAVVVHHVPTFWRLALSIFSGKFAKVTSSMNGNLALPKAGMAPPFESARYPSEGAVSTYTSHSLEEVVTMVHCMISMYESKVHNAFLALTDVNVLRPYSREAMAEISKACVALQGRQCAAASAVQMLFVLRIETTRVFVLRLCTIMHAATLELVNAKDWMPVASVERGSSPFAISGLPLGFRDILVTAMEHLREMLERLKRDEPDLHEDMVSQLHRMQDTARYTFFECFLTLAENLDKLALDLLQEAPLAEGMGNESGQEQAGHAKFVGLMAGMEVMNPHQRLLMVLSNTGFCNSVLLPELSNKYQLVWSYFGANGGSTGKGPGGNTATLEEATAALCALEEKILGQYNLVKATAVRLAAAAYMMDEGTQWSAFPPAKGIRDAVLELLHPLVSVHAEVYAGAKPFLGKVMKHLAEGLMGALVDIITENKTKIFEALDINGYCQLMLEIEYIEAVLDRYLTLPAHQMAGRLQVLLLDKVMEVVGDTKDNIGHRRRTTWGSNDGMGLDERSNFMMQPEEMQVFAQERIADLLPNELKRTRLNVFCFTPEINLEMQREKRGGLSQQRPRVSSGITGSGLNRHLHKSSSSSTDSDSGKPSNGLPPISPHVSYTSSEAGSRHRHW